MLTLNDGRAELWQWDTGRTLGVDADCSQVHFSNKVFGRSIDVDVVGGVAIIPDILLQTDNDLNVWAFVGTAENGYTKISKTFKVNRRNKPADYVFTPVDQKTLDDLQSQIGDLSDLTTEAKDTLVAAINEAARTGGGGGGSTVELDTTLTQSGKAADAKAVGDALAGKQDTISDLEAIRSGAAKGATALQSVPSTYRTAAAQDVIDAKKQDTLIQSGASVGQIVKISAVDDTGKPTAWEAMNIPEQVQADWNQNDDTQPDYVKNRPFYSETRNMTIENVTEVSLEGFPTFVTGDTVTVNVDGVEHSLVAYYDESEGVFTIGDIYSDLENGKGQLGWQFWSDGESQTYFYATEAHTISYIGVFTYKIDDKFLNLDGLVRTFDYHFKDYALYKNLYNSAGDKCTLYTSSDFILPKPGSKLFGCMSELGFSIVDSVDLFSCFITGVKINTINSGISIVRVVLGADTSYMEDMAASHGYTYTTNPNA